MKKLEYSFNQKKRASTLVALALSECDAAGKLIETSLYREALVHMYFTCFYTSQALLCKHLSANPSHANVESTLHKVFGRSRTVPRRYVNLHSALHRLRTEFNYRSTHSPDPVVIRRYQTQIEAFVKVALRLVPRLEITEILEGIYVGNKDTIKDFSFDIYCPRTYSHHTRITFWQPPFYLSIFGPNKLAKHSIECLRQLKVRKAKDYVVGLNSKLDQYEDNQLLMLDIDTVDAGIESALKPIGGILFKSGRGFHFIGSKVIIGQMKWKAQMRRLLKHRQLGKHIDRDHIKLSIKRGYATLRVTANEMKSQVPFFYKEL